MHHFARYLEQAQPAEFSPTTGDLRWLDEHSIRGTSRWRSATAGPSSPTRRVSPGSYLARWQVGTETLYRYFAAIEDHWIVLRLSTFVDLEAEPTLHATGIPLDYRLPARTIRSARPAVPQVPRLPSPVWRRDDSAFARHATGRLRSERLQQYGTALRHARSLMPDARDVRSARVEMHHELDPGYTQHFMQLGVNDHCGLNEANAKPWLGMPEFPYFASPIDCRKMNQDAGGSVLAHQWDFCGGWHFLGPVSWHYKAVQRRLGASRAMCLRGGVAELENLAQLSGHPAFAVPLYDGLVAVGLSESGVQLRCRASRATSAA